jgi:hypothetical protein
MEYSKAEGIEHKPVRSIREEGVRGKILAT